MLNGAFLITGIDFSSRAWKGTLLSFATLRMCRLFDRELASFPKSRVLLFPSRAGKTVVPFIETRLYKNIIKCAVENKPRCPTKVPVKEKKKKGKIDRSVSTKKQSVSAMARVSPSRARNGKEKERKVKSIANGSYTWRSVSARTNTYNVYTKKKEKSKKEESRSKNGNEARAPAGDQRFRDYRTVLVRQARARTNARRMRIRIRKKKMKRRKESRKERKREVRAARYPVAAVESGGARPPRTPRARLRRRTGDFATDSARRIRRPSRAAVYARSRSVVNKRCGRSREAAPHVASQLLDALVTLHGAWITGLFSHRLRARCKRESARVVSQRRRTFLAPRARSVAVRRKDSRSPEKSRAPRDSYKKKREEGGGRDKSLRANGIRELACGSTKPRARLAKVTTTRNSYLGRFFHRRF